VARDESTRRVEVGEAGNTTVRCAFPEEAAATLRLTEQGRPLSTQASGPELAPRRSARFEDLGELARGGMSSVRKVFDRVVLREVAMKVLAPERTLDELSRFIEEAQITGQLDHPNIVPVHDIETDEKGLPTRFTMKLVRGHTLHTYLGEQLGRELGAHELEDVLRIVLKVCDAVAFAHSRGVIHRDLKPSNIMIGTHGQVYVMDWGVAKLRQGTRPSELGLSVPEPLVRTPDTLPEPLGTLTGTPSFMAPEQAHGRTHDIDERTDVYGLGGILYYVLTGRPPHDGADVQEDLRLARIGEILPPSEVAPGKHLPPLLCRIALKALAAEPRDRHPSVNELKQDLETFLRGGGWFAQRHCAPGTEIVREGDEADAAYIVTQGQCELSRMVDGQRQFVRLLGPGDVFGETAIFGSSKRTATITAHGEVTLLVVTRDALERELDRSLWLRAFVEAVAERFVEADRALRRIANTPPRE
jgi:eukaryotic-like serine/threonine-protein kinase